MEEDESPIYKFDGLKQLLTRLGYQIGQATGYREVENVDVELDDLRNNMEFTDEGIFLINPADGSRQQIFLYKRNYHLDLYGKPRFHIRNCQTIQSFIESGTFKREYRRANTENVLVCDMDDGYTDKQVESLPLCKFCAKMVAEEYQNMDSTDFVQILREANEASIDDVRDSIEVDIFGYTKNWEKVSRAYRESKEFTCERCGVQILDPFEQHFIHVHHRNGDKVNNRTENLECLCIRCHSNVDDVHRTNFSRGANRVLLQEFEEKYPEND